MPCLSDQRYRVNISEHARRNRAQQRHEAERRERHSLESGRRERVRNYADNAAVTISTDQPSACCPHTPKKGDVSSQSDVRLCGNIPVFRFNFFCSSSVCKILCHSLFTRFCGCLVGAQSPGVSVFPGFSWPRSSCLIFHLPCFSLVLRCSRPLLWPRWRRAVPAPRLRRGDCFVTSGLSISTARAVERNPCSRPPLPVRPLPQLLRRTLYPPLSRSR